jgi:hypothetical protein
MTSKHQLAFTFVVLAVIACAVIASALKPVIDAQSEAYRWQKAEEMVERRRWQQTEYEAELAERAIQAEQTEATKATVFRSFLWCCAIGGGAMALGYGYSFGKTKIRAAEELPPTRQVDDGLILVNGAMYDRYSGMQTVAGVASAPSLEHAQAYGIAKSAGREQWIRLAYSALSVLPQVVMMLRDNGIEPPREAAGILDALPEGRGTCTME